MKPRRITIEWTDAAAGCEWEDIEDIHYDTTECLTSGYLVSENDDALIIAATVALGHDGEIESVNATMQIPKSIIKNRYEEEAR